MHKSMSDNGNPRRDRNGDVLFHQAGCGNPLAEKRRGFERCSMTIVVESHSAVPSDSGSSVGIVQVVTSSPASAFSPMPHHHMLTCATERPFSCGMSRSGLASLASSHGVCVRPIRVDHDAPVGAQMIVVPVRRTSRKRRHAPFYGLC
jgi:hypothetical protein